MIPVVLFDEKMNGLCNVGISFQVFGLAFRIILSPCEIKSDCKPVFTPTFLFKLWSTIFLFSHLKTALQVPVKCITKFEPVRCEEYLVRIALYLFVPELRVLQLI